MQEFMINHPGLMVRRKTGAEGPSHDPYHYEEITAKTKRGTATYHEGALVSWLELRDNDGLGTKVREPDQKPEDMRKTFAHFVGYKIEELERIYLKCRDRCRKCGGRSFVSVNGYPGEYLELCTNCNNVVGSYFCKGEVE